MTQDKRYGMFGLSEADIQDRGGVTLLPDEARALLDRLTAADVRFRGEQFELCIDGEWRRVCRQDLDRQVRTSGELQSVKDCREAIVYGVRLEDGAFTIVDCLTDG